MITWMQRHRKYLVVTIWISTIAFIGAGFVGWGQYSYGDKAGAVAKVGDVPITMEELQKTYSLLYNQYNQIFQGNFDEAQAKSFGLDKQALQQLINQALMLNLANELGLRVTDKELLSAVQSETAFTKDGSFDIETYSMVLKQNGMSKKEYEAQLRRSMLIQKVMNQFAPSALPLEKEVLNTAMYIADRIDYKVITANAINLDTSDASLKPFWELRKNNYMTLPRYELSVVRQPTVKSEHNESLVKEHYESKRHSFTDSEGKLLDYEAARPQVIASLDDKATKTAALRNYLAMKKGEGDMTAETLTVDAQNNPLGEALFEQIAALTPEEPFIKAEKSATGYVTLKLENILPAEPKTYEAARNAVMADYLREEKSKKLMELAQKSAPTFKGKTSGFLTRDSIDAIDGLSETESAEFLNALFEQQQRRGFIPLKDGKIVLYNILEQKLLDESKTDQENSVMRLKSSLLDSNLVSALKKRYDINIFIEGF